MVVVLGVGGKQLGVVLVSSSFGSSGRWFLVLVLVLLVLVFLS